MNQVARWGEHAFEIRVPPKLHHSSESKDHNRARVTKKGRIFMANRGAGHVQEHSSAQVVIASTDIVAMKPVMIAVHAIPAHEPRGQSLTEHAPSFYPAVGINATISTFCPVVKTPCVPPRAPARRIAQRVIRVRWMGFVRHQRIMISMKGVWLLQVKPGFRRTGGSSWPASGCRVSGARPPPIAKNGLAPFSDNDLEVGQDAIAAG